MASGYNKSEKSSSQKAIDQFAEMMIKRMEEMKNSDWQKGWIGGYGVGMPQNVSGRSYSGSNSFFLQLFTAAKSYATPVFMTFNQAHKLNAHVLKGEKSFPVTYWDVVLRDKDGKKISREDYNAMSKEERKEITAIPFFKTFPVYNVDQTNLKEVKPELYAKLVDKFRPIELKDTTGMYVNRELDRMVSQKEWVCPIIADTPSNRAFYSPSRDVVVIPMKAQFNKGGTADDIYAHGQEYYSTMLHEMTHSTLTPDRLNRTVGSHFGDMKYAKEELVAELTAAMVGNSLGFDRRITDNSATYLDNWIKVLKEEPKFIVSVMSDVNKASDMILSHIDKQRMALDMPTLQCKTDSEAKSRTPELSGDREVSVQRAKKGETSVRMTVDGESLGIKPLTRHEAFTYNQLSNRPEGAKFIENVASRKFETELNNHSQKKESALKIG